MKYYIRFVSNSIASLGLKQQEFEVGSLSVINIPLFIKEKFHNQYFMAYAQ